MVSTANVSSPVTAFGADRSASVYATFRRRIVPVLVVLSVIAFLDRQNISFAKLGMAGDLALSESAFALGASMFFIGYVLFDVPSNLMLMRMASGRWFAVITAGWGLSTVGLAFTNSVAMFYVLRFLLGAFEAGFLPGVMYITTQWLPFRFRARVVGLVLAAGVMAFVIGSPICGTLLDLDGMLGLRGWQWVFLMTGLPAVILALPLVRLLPSSPQTAPFYDPQDRAWLAHTLSAENAAITGGAHSNPFKVFLDPRLLIIALPLMGVGFGSMGLNYWLPTVIEAFGVSNTVNGWLNAIPWSIAVLALWWLPAHAERVNERRLHCAIPTLMAASALIALPFVISPGAQLALLSIGAAGIFSVIPIYWTLPSRFFTGSSAAAGIGAIGSLGNIGGGIGQLAVGLIRDWSGSVSIPLLVVGTVLLVSGGLAAVMITREPK